MKRLKGPSASSRGESYGPAQKPTPADALNYLKEVKEMFHDQKEKYEMFLSVMKAYKTQRIETSGVIARVKELLKGHDNLILGFNNFLPKGYEITIAEDEEEEEEEAPKPAVEFEDAMNFVSKIKRRFQTDVHVYNSFLRILKMYRNRHKFIQEVYHEVTALFRDHPDLLDEFIRFLPDDSATTSLQHMTMDKQPRRDRNLASNVDHAIAGERADMDDDKAMVKLLKNQRKRAEKESRESEHESNRGFTMQRVNDKRKFGRMVEDMESNPAVSLNDKNAMRSIYKHEFIFCEKVKERMRSADDYHAFLRCLHIYSTEIITRKELQRLVADLIGKYPDLMKGFDEFLDRCENIDGFLGMVMSKKSSTTGVAVPRSVKSEEKDKEQKRETEVVKDNRNNEKYMEKSIHELDLSSCQRCTPSYLLLPDDYPIRLASQRSELGAQVLNDNWVSLTSGSEDYSFTHMRRNQYEESLFRCEDDRFELDMLLESANAAAKRAEDLLNRFNENTINLDNPIRLEDYFTVLNLRCIERLYGDHGLDVLDILRKNPSAALPVILTRLKQKQEEWNKCRLDFNKVWADVYAKNHYKSLDHRSFYFKQQDSKNLSTKALVADIKEIKEKMQKVDDVALSISAGSRYRISSNLVYEYSDNEIHEDLYKLVKYSCEEVCTTKEQFNKVIRLWTTFLEPMLGVTSRPESIEEAEKARTYTGKAIKASLGESNGNKPAVDADKPMSNVNKSPSPEITSSSKTSKANEDTSAKDDNPHLDEGLVNASASLTLLADNIYESTGPVDDKKESRSKIDDVPSLEGGKLPKPVPQANGVFEKSTKTSRYQKESAEPSKIEREEGELSPNVDFEEDNFETKHSNESLQENEVDADDDRDSENNSEGESVSGSVSAADVFSHEEHEEDEKQDKMDCKDEITPSVSENFLETAKPVAKHFPSTLPGNEKNEDSRVFYASDNIYVLFRLHQVLYDRLLTAKQNSTASEMKSTTAKDANPPDLYGRFMSALHGLLDGSSDNAKFEDNCRAIFGNQAYVLFTLDKLIYKLVKQLQTVSGDETDNKLLLLYEYEKSRTPGQYVESVHYDNVRILLYDENIYRLESSCAPFHLSIQLMGDGNDKSDVVAVTVDPKFAAYLYNEFLSVVSSKRGPPSIFLKRNKRKYADLDESSAICKALDNAYMVNGLECKMTCSSSKISYVFDTEDSFYRVKKRRISSYNDQERIQRFHRFLVAS